MSRIVVLSDIHMGLRRNSKVFHNILLRELDWSFQHIKKTDSVVILGDLFDSRTSIDFNILNDAWNYFIRLSRSCKELYILSGNHDGYYKEFSRDTTNCRFLEFEPGSDSKIAPVKVITELSNITIAGYNCLFIPWIDHIDKKNAAKNALDGSIDIIFGHFDTVGLYNNTDLEANTIAFDVEDFKDVPLVLSGHFHKRIAVGNIRYVGSFINSTFNDIDDIKGLHIINKDLKIEFKPNNCPRFHHLTIDSPIDFIKAFEASDENIKNALRDKIKGNFIKLFLNEYRIENDMVYKIIKDMNPIDVTISFKSAEFKEEAPVDFEGFDSKTDISVFLMQYIDTIKNKFPKDISIDNIKQLINRKSLEFKQLT